MVVPSTSCALYDPNSQCKASYFHPDHRIGRMVFSAHTPTGLAWERVSALLCVFFFDQKPLKLSFWTPQESLLTLHIWNTRRLSVQLSVHLCLSLKFSSMPLNILVFSSFAIVICTALGVCAYIFVQVSLLRLVDS